MSRLNHDRPELRWRDNLRRELAKTSSLQANGPQDLKWPAFIRPVAANPKALAALFALLESVNNWASDDSRQFSFDEPTEQVRLSFVSFAQSKVENKYDSFFTGYDWLMQAEGDREIADQDFRPLLLIFLKSVIHSD
jgi:hypothetical protein